MEIIISTGDHGPVYSAADLLKMTTLERAAFALRRFAWKEYGKYTHREADRLRAALIMIVEPHEVVPDTLLCGAHDARWQDIIKSLPAQVLPACKRGALTIARGSGRAPVTPHMFARIDALFGGGPLVNDIEVTEQERQLADVAPYHEKAPQYRLQIQVNDAVDILDASIIPLSTHTRGTTVFDFGSRTERSVEFDDLVSVVDISTGEILTTLEFYLRSSRGGGITNLLMCFEGRRLCWVLTSMLRTVNGRVQAGDRSIIRDGVNSLLADPVPQKIVDPLISRASGDIEIAGGLPQILRRLSENERAACLEFGGKLPAYNKGGKELMTQWLETGSGT